MTNHINHLKHKIHQLEQHTQLDHNESVRSKITTLENELTQIHKKRYKNTYARAQTQWQIKGEMISKYWTTVVTPRCPHDPIYALHNPQTNNLTTRTSDMAEIAGHYHDKLQHLDLPIYNDPNCQTARLQVLHEIPPTQVLNDNNSLLNQPLTEELVTCALLDSKNGTATGLDGIPYELWKTLHNLHVSYTKTNKPSFNITRCFQIIYNEIQLTSSDPSAHFSEGWMYPLYKKKDQTRIENYCLITLLNTDYKTMTKALATQLAQHACDLLHPDQTGFVPSRSIFDPIRLVETMCAYADYTEENGTIVALDQEKVYNKIDHKYLLDTLHAFHLPNIFIHTIESLYNHATTTIIINGVMSQSYTITRGVCQGDPLSCLLFNLAIEPLAASIRNSPDIQGFQIPGAPSNI